MLMRILCVLVFVSGAACGTQANPDLCCTTQSDCDSVGIPLGTGCGDGLVCRGNQCIGETCADSSSCDAAAPYCNGQSCAETCTDDIQCPGFGQGAANTFCVTGACAACRIDHDDCPAAAPICEGGACRACRVDADCPSELCEIDTGACVDSSAILYASPNGASTADCSQATPCSLPHAMTGLDADHTILRLLDGTYAYGLNFPSGSVATVVGPGATLTGTNSGGGVITVVDNSVISVRGLTIDAGGAAYPMHCQALSTGMSTVTLRDTQQLEFAAELFSVNCKTTVLSSRIQSRIQSNGGGSITVDRTSFQGLYAQNGNHLIIDIQNSVMLEGVSMSGDQTGFPILGRIAFSTFYMTTSMACSAPLNLENDIFVGTGGSAYSFSHPTNCIFDHNIVFPQDAPIGNAMLIEDPKFVDAANGDFHLMSGSPAIDFANPAATDAIDFDGVSRPQGNGRDLGAFEYH